MEILKEKVEDFVKNNYNIGSGSGSGNGYGNGYGYGSGSGNGYGYGSGSGNGYGNGYGYGYDYSTDTARDKIKRFNNQDVYNIDSINTIITSIHGNVAKGFILNQDFTTELCYIVKGNNLFAHGKTARKAMLALQEKIFENLDVKEIIEEFKKKFNNNDKYEGTEFYRWHNYLTNSCKMGRDSFVKNHNINLKDKFTVKEFIEICENNYGGNIIKKLKKYYK